MLDDAGPLFCVWNLKLFCFGAKGYVLRQLFARLLFVRLYFDAGMVRLDVSQLGVVKEWRCGRKWGREGVEKGREGGEEGGREGGRIVE